MKKIIVLLMLISTSFFYGQEYKTKVHWLTDFELAKKQAKEQKKPILMLFTGSDWCPPCKMLKKDYFNSDKFADRSKDFVMLMVDFPRNKELLSEAQQLANKELNSTYGVRSLPTLLAVNYKGKVIDKIKRYNSARDTSNQNEFLDKVLKR